MRLTKYDGVSDPTIKAVLGSLGGSETSSSSGDLTTRGAGYDLDRKIWGQSDTGEDIDGSMVVNGNVSIKVIVPPQYDPEEGDPEEDDDGEDVETETGGGNLDVELKVTAKQAEFKEAKYASDYNLPKEDSSSKFASTEWVKSQIPDLKTLTVKDSLGNQLGTYNTKADVTITVPNHKNEIDSLDSRVTDNEGDIADIYDKISNLNGEIGNISSDTIIDGNVKWNSFATNTNTNSGFVMLSDSSQMKISCNNVGDYNNFINNNSSTESYINTQRTINCSGALIVGATSYDITGSTTIDIGNYNSGDYIKFKNIAVNYTLKTNYSNIKVTSVTFDLVSTSNSKTFNTSSYSNFEWTVSTSKSYQLKITIKGSCNYNTSSGGFQEANPNVDFTISFDRSKSGLKTNLIGADGIGFSFGSGHIYLNSDCAVILYGDYGLKINNTGIYKNHTTYWEDLPGYSTRRWVPLNALKTTLITGDYTVQPEDDLILYETNNKNITVTLPAIAWYDNDRPLIIREAADSSSITVKGLVPGSILPKGSTSWKDSITINNEAITLIAPSVGKSGWIQI